MTQNHGNMCIFGKVKGVLDWHFVGKPKFTNIVGAVNDTVYTIRGKKRHLKSSSKNYRSIYFFVKNKSNQKSKKLRLSHFLITPFLSPVNRILLVGPKVTALIL